MSDNTFLQDLKNDSFKAALDAECSEAKSLDIAQKIHDLILYKYKGQQIYISSQYYSKKEESMYEDWTGTNWRELMEKYGYESERGVRKVINKMLKSKTMNHPSGQQKLF